MKTRLIAALPCLFALSCAVFAEEVPEPYNFLESGRIYEIEEHPVKKKPPEEVFDRPSEIRARPVVPVTAIRRVVRKRPAKPVFDATTPMANEYMMFAR